MPLDKEADLDAANTKNLTDDVQSSDAASNEAYQNSVAAEANQNNVTAEANQNNIDAEANQNNVDAEANQNNVSAEQNSEEDSSNNKTIDFHLTAEQQPAAPQFKGLKQVIDELVQAQRPFEQSGWYASFPPSMQGPAKAASPLYPYLDLNESGGFDPKPLSIETSIDILNLGKYAGGLDALLLGLSDRRLSQREVVEQVLSHLSKIKRQYRAVQLYLAAGFPISLANERFDPNLCSADEEQVTELLTCRWLAEGLSVVMVGEPGRGKTLLAIHLGKTAVSLGYSTIFLNATDFFIKLKRHQERYGDVIKGDLFKCKLLIIDDIGHDLSSEIDISNLFYRLVDYRDANGCSTIFTSNQMPQKWVGCIKGQTDTRKASLDRILHSCVMVFHQGTGSLRMNKFKQLNPKLNVINE